MALPLKKKLFFAACLIVNIDFFCFKGDPTVRGQDICSTAVQAGVDFTTFAGDITHVIHSFTVETIRIFFDERFPIKNNIPTVNFNLTFGDAVLPYAPYYPSVFTLPLAKSFDVLLQHNDNPDEFGAQGLSSTHAINTLEKFAHQIHMFEMFNKLSPLYKSITRENVDVDRVCPCLIDDGARGVLRALAGFARRFTKGYNEGQELKDSQGWASWKSDNFKRMPWNEDSSYAVCLYIFCKIEFLV